MRKIIVMFMILFSTFVYSEEKTTIDKQQAMIEFDQPLLLGKWASERRYDKRGNQYSMTLFLASDYSYSLLYKQNNKITTSDFGFYTSNEKKLILTSSINNKTLSYDLEYTYNKLIFGVVSFIKYPELKLAGSWFGVKGKEEERIKVKSLVLEPNFVFKANFEDSEGRSREEVGVYVVEQDRILFLYSEGINIGVYEINDGELKLNMEKGDFLVTMRKESAM